MKMVNMQSLFYQQTVDMTAQDQPPPPQPTVGHYPQLLEALQTPIHTVKRKSLNQPSPQLPLIEESGPEHVVRHQDPSLGPPSNKTELPSSPAWNIPYSVRRCWHSSKSNQHASKMVAMGSSIPLRQRDDIDDTMAKSPQKEVIFGLPDGCFAPSMPFLLPRDGGPRQPTYRRLSRTPAQKLGRTRIQIQDVSKLDNEFSLNHAEIVNDRLMGRLGSKLSQRSLTKRQNLTKREQGVSFV